MDKKKKIKNLLLIILLIVFTIISCIAIDYTDRNPLFIGYSTLGIISISAEFIYNNIQKEND